MKRSAIATGISSLFILLFIYAAISKFLEGANFTLQIAKSPFITNYASLITWALPVIEILVAALLIFKNTLLFGLYASLFLMSTFTMYIYSMLHFSFSVPCSCGGILSSMGWHTHLWFNIFFVILSIIGILITESPRIKLLQSGATENPKKSR